MTDIEIRPYELINGIQNYSWGGKNEKAYIPGFLGTEPEKDKPYAELWIGAHPKLPSEVVAGSKNINLGEFIASAPEKILGTNASKKFDGKLPFLFKILSAGEALSIQAHPSKEQAEILHKNDPVNYPDDNHKPEIAIALDDLAALVGFRSTEEIISTMSTYPGIAEFAGTGFLTVPDNESESIKIWLKDLYSKVMNKSLSDESLLADTLADIEKTIIAKPEVTDERERLFLDLKKQYGNDVGLLSIFFLNLTHLKKGEAVFLKAGIPHAYLKGNIVECMANSDNVVRAGLTPKFKDVSTLIEILTYENGLPEIMGKDNWAGDYIYKTPVPEFEIKKYVIGQDTIRLEKSDVLQIFIVISGKIELHWEKGKMEFAGGKTFLIPAALNEYEITGIEDSLLFKAYIP